MTLLVIPFSALGVPHPSEARWASRRPRDECSRDGGAGRSLGGAPYAGPSNTACSSRSMRTLARGWSLSSRSPWCIDSFPYQIDHLGKLCERFSNPMFWFWRLTLSSSLLRCSISAQGAPSRAAQSFWCCSSSSLRGHVVNDAPWYYAFIPTARFTRWAPWVPLRSMRALD